MARDIQITSICVPSRPYSRCKTAFVLVLVLLAASMVKKIQAESADSRVWISQAGLFHVTYKSKLHPIVINRIHNWVLRVELADGQPVTNADITVEGGMPAHDHGLPTLPRMTQSLGNGEYLLEGMRFHMNGYWEISITINAGGDRDTIIIPLEL